MATSLAAILSALNLPLLTVYYLPPQLRQDRDWSYRQALMNKLLKSFLRNYTAAHVKQPLSLKPRFEGDRFAVIEPASPELYIGVVEDKVIKPERIGGTWYPVPYQANDPLADDQHVVLHLHGGSYVLGDGRTASCQSLVNTLLSNTPAKYVFSLQYRLACNSNARFPAQLQDLITAYSFLLHTLHVPPSRIVISGDSSGAHLTIAFLRYIVDHPNILPAPKCSWLFSPWCDIPEATDTKVWRKSPNYQTEYIPATFPEWGASQFLKDVEITEHVERYVAPLWHPFTVPSPVLVVTGGREVLAPEHIKMAQSLQNMTKDDNSRVELFVENKVPHDVLMVGWILGFREEAKRCASRAGEFVGQVQAIPEKDQSDKSTHAPGYSLGEIN